MTDDYTRVQSWIPAEWEGQIENELEYGDSFSGWIRDAIKLRLDMENDRDPELSSQVDS